MPPAQLALATILQAYTGASDDEVVEACVMDRRWQLVLDCMDHAQPPFSKGTLVGFRARLIASELDRRLVERTVELYAQQAGRPAAGKLRAALDASPLWGAGRWRTRSTWWVTPCAGAGRAGRPGVVGLAAAERARLLAGPSVKAALDLDRDDEAVRGRTLWAVLDALAQVERLAAGQPGGDDLRVAAGLAVARQVRGQDTAVGVDGVVRYRQWPATGGHDAVHAGRQGPVPCGGVPGLPAAGAVQQQPAGAQRAGPR